MKILLQLMCYIVMSALAISLIMLLVVSPVWLGRTFTMFNDEMLSMVIYGVLEFSVIMGISIFADFNL